MKIEAPNRALPTEQSVVNGDRQKVHEMANEFEAMFLEIVMKSMRESVQKSGFIDGGNAEDIYRSMLDFEYAKNMANQRSTGIADALERQLFDLSSKGLKSVP